MGLLGLNKGKGLFGEFGAATIGAFANDDYATLANIQKLKQQRKDDEASRQAALQQREQLAGALSNMGYTPDQITVALTNPQEFAKRYNEQFGTFQSSPGASVAVGGAGGVKEAYRTPSAPTELEREYGFYKGLGQDKADQFVSNKLAPPVDWQSAQNPDGTKTLFPIPRGAPMMQQQPKVGDVMKAPWASGGAGSGSRTFR